MAAVVNGNLNSTVLNEEENKKIREKYKDLINETKQIGEQNIDALNQIIKEASHVFEGVTMPREALYDSTLMNLQTGIIKQKARSLHSNLNAFKVEEFVSKLKNAGVTKALDIPRKPYTCHIWRALGGQSKFVINTAPSFNFLFGSFEPEPVEVKKRTLKVKKKKVDLIEDDRIQKPNLVDVSESNQGQQATEEAEKILSILFRHGGPISYFDFVLNPESFSETVENMFYVSILVKEAAVKIYFDSKNMPVIEPMLQKEKLKHKKLFANYTQCIFSISEPEWKELVTEFKIIKPRIPTREKN